MRVAYVSADPGVPVFGRKGCSIHVQEVVRALVRRGADLHLLAAAVGGAAPPDLADAVRVHALPALPKGDIAARERAAVEANGDLAAALDRLGPFDLVYERQSLWSFAGMTYAAARGAPGVLEVNAPLIDEQARYRGLADAAQAREIAARTFAAATAVVAVSDAVAAYVRSAAPGTAARVHVVPNGVDAERFRPDVPPSRPAPAGTCTVGFVGSMKPWHGLPTLVDAFARVYRDSTAWRLLLVGDGDGRAELERQAARLGCAGGVQVIGAVDAAAVPGLIASMDVAVAPYPAIEPFYFSPLKVYEYMAAGRAVVASRVGAIDGLIRHGETGLLCPPGDADALAAAVAAVGSDVALRARLGRAARADVLRHRTWDAAVDRILRLALPGGTAAGRGSMAGTEAAVPHTLTRPA